MEKASVKDWVSEHLGEMITVIVIIVGNIVGYAKLLYTVMTQGEQLKELRGEVEKHTDNTALHRNADFEQRLTTISDELR
jgi:hypothetical protein